MTDHYERKDADSARDGMILRIKASDWEALQQRVRELEEALRDMADAVCVWSRQPPHPLRKRDILAQSQWDQLADAVREMVRKALGDTHD